MSTIVCQNLVSCFESQLTETTTTLKLKVAPPPLATDDHRNLEFGNWAFLQTSPANSGDKQSFNYAKYSTFSRLSSKSLELCTENLGSETGSDTVSDSSSIFSLSPPLSPASNSGDNFRSVHDLHDWKRKPKASPCRKTIGSFPPPLTTMSGSSSLQVRRHWEGGRLIIEAVETPFRNSYMQAERSDGRLKLCFFTSYDDAETTAAEQEVEAEEEEEEEVDEEYGGETAADEEFEGPTNEIESEREEFDGEINLEMEKFQRLSRCKEGSHGDEGLCRSWKPALWVATS